MPITPFQAQEMLNRLALSKHRSHPNVIAAEPTAGERVSREIEQLHNPTIKWCRENRVPYSHTRTDCESTIGVGVCDFIIPYRRKVFFIEYKTETGKLSIEQQAFEAMLGLQGHKLHVLRQFDAFLELMRTAGTEAKPQL